MTSQHHDLSELYSEMLSAGRRAGLSGSQVEQALARISTALQQGLGQGTGTSLLDAGRLVESLQKNLADNPMLVGWALKIAATVAEPIWDAFIENFVLGLVLDRKPVREAGRQELGFPPPITLVLNPTMRCDLRCKGCYAYNIERQTDMDRDLLRKVLGEARDLGVRFITITGGEPFMYPDIEGLFAEFSDLIFMVYTNGQHLDEARVTRLAALGNVWPAISVEGYEAETDARRGPGVYRKLTAAMERLRDAGVLFGISAVPTRYNTDLLAADEFLDHYIERGAQFGWMFTYMPVGRKPDLDLMATPAQRDQLRRKGLQWRRTKPFFFADFWNDGALCGGCLSASRYLYITPEGWAQPCTFVHFATHNIKDHTLREIFESPLFRGIRERQPYSSNLLRPCKIIDHPEVLREVVAEFGARPTCDGAEAIIEDPELRAFLDRYSREYAALADRAWATEDYRAGHSVLVPFFGRVDLHQAFGDRMESAAKQDEKMRADLARASGD